MAFCQKRDITQIKPFLSSLVKRVALTKISQPEWALKNDKKHFKRLSTGKNIVFWCLSGLNA